MTVATETSRSTYTGNGVTDSFSTGFYFTDETQLVVRYTPSGGVETVWVLGADYTVTMPASVGAAGSVQATTPPAASSALVIERDVDMVQATSFRGQGNFSPSVHEDALDYATFGLQELERRVTDLESAGAPGSVVAGDGLSFSGATLHVGAGFGVAVGADTVAVNTSDLAGDGLEEFAAKLKVTADDGILVTATGVAVDFAASTEDVDAQAGVVGTGLKAARNDHTHQVLAGVTPPAAVGTAADVGASTDLALADHVHAHGAQTDETLHAVATTSLDGFMTAEDKAKLDGLTADNTLEGVVKTTNATPATVLSWDPTDETVEYVDLWVAGRKSGAVDSGGYGIRLTIRRYDNTVSIVDQDAVHVAHETNAAWDVTVSNTASTVSVLVTGAAATTIYWKAQARRMIVSSET